MEPRSRPLITAESIQQRVAELALEISSDFAERPIRLIVVLKGGAIFAADLMRALTVPVSLDFIGARSYVGTTPGGDVQFTFLPSQPMAGRHILLVEDILDTGCTVDKILERLRHENPASIAICTLLNKPARRKVAVSADYVGFTIDDFFVVGYGLDYEERGRELKDIHVLDREE